MSKVFRFQIYTKKYEEECHFYGDILGLPIKIMRETSVDDRVRVYSLGSGELEVIYCPDWMECPVSKGWTLQVEVDNVDDLYKKVQQHENVQGREPRDFFWGHRNCKVVDPSGFELTFFNPIDAE